MTRWQGRSMPRQNAARGAPLGRQTAANDMSGSAGRVDFPTHPLNTWPNKGN
jgi:hypothetical protein